MSENQNTPAEPEQESGPASKPAAKVSAKGAPPVSRERQRQGRRKVLRTILLTGGVLGAGLSGYLPLVYARTNRLRPPGALDEKEFLSSCIKCGQCVQVCPVNAIKLADLIDGFGVGVPYIDAREQACDFSCDAVQCILACPTGSLTYEKPEFLPVREGAALPQKPTLIAKMNDPEPTLNMTERMGVARLTRPESCLAMKGEGFKGQARGPDFKGTMRYIAVDRWKPIPVADHPYDLELCDLCMRECPIAGAISLEKFTGPDGKTRARPIVHENCVGCGVCEMICPTEPASITIIAREVWQS
ncbi:MAG: 4Fe-4S dicluster domain-containing protein [Thauera sp.]|jgi:ferredoxin-type protein NapG